MSDWASTRLNLRYRWKTLLVWGIGVVLVFLALSGRAGSWTTEGVYQPFPNGEATIIVHRFCFSAECPLEQREWETFIQDAVDIWDGAGSNFEFHTRRMRSTDDPCNLQDGEVAVIWTDGQQTCPEHLSLPPARGSLKGVAAPLIGQNAARVYFYAKPGPVDAYLLRQLLPTYLVHELGHVWGLGHPDQARQVVDAIMNSTFGPNPLDDTLQPDDIAGIQGLYGVKVADVPEGGLATWVNLENPRDGSTQSGIGVISGWICDAESVRILIMAADNWQDVKLDTRAAYGTQRRDTESICGEWDWDNGFGLLFNWNSLGDGDYRIMAQADDGRYSWRYVSVATLGEDFLRGVEGRYVLEGFPGPGQSVVVEWEQSLQNFLITEHRR